MNYMKTKRFSKILQYILQLEVLYVIMIILYEFVYEWC